MSQRQRPQEGSPKEPTAPSRGKLDRLLMRINRPAKIFLASLTIVLVLVFSAWKYIDINYLSPVNKNSTTPIPVVIERGSTVNAIATALEESGVIRSTTVFKLYVDIMDKGSKLKAGNYEFTASMTVEEVLDKLIAGDTSENVLKITLTPGKTIEDLADILLAEGHIENKEAFLQNMKTGQQYLDSYYFLDLIPKETASQRRYLLEGYLFPDTYFLFDNMGETEIIKLFLNRLNSVYSPEFAQRAESLNMTMDQVLTLASIIEKEGKSKDFSKVSAVFHNRLKEGMRLQSDPTIKYTSGSNKFIVSKEDREKETPYNTYTIPALPIGPICSPSKAAIQAALYPDEEYVQEKYLYFCSKDPKSGDLDFSKTLDEHNKKVEKYKPLWEEYDKEN